MDESNTPRTNDALLTYLTGVTVAPNVPHNDADADDDGLMDRMN
jgi:hypothetical protein